MIAPVKEFAVRQWNAEGEELRDWTAVLTPSGELGTVEVESAYEAHLGLWWLVVRRSDGLAVKIEASHLAFEANGRDLQASECRMYADHVSKRAPASVWHGILDRLATEPDRTRARFGLVVLSEPDMALWRANEC